MSAEPQQSVLTEEAIQAVVAMTRAAEVVAACMHITVHEAMEMQLRVVSAMQTAQADTKAAALASMTVASKLTQ